MIVSQFTQPFEHKTIAQLFSDEQANSNEEIYQSIILLLACDSSLINQKFVKDWIYFTNSLKKQLLDVEVKLQRISIVGTQTTYQLLQESQTTQNIQPILILDQIQKLQQYIELKKTKIPNFDFIQLEAAKLQSVQNIKQTEKFLQQLKEYHTDLLNCSQHGTSSFQLQSSNDFQDIQNQNQPHQQQQQILNIVTPNSKNNDKV